jgi:FtsH-binding integral membrane protein
VSRRTNDIEWNAVRAGALAAIAICLPVSVIGKVLVDDPEHSSVTPIIFVAVLAGFAVGGWVAAKRSLESPYTVALLSSLGAFVLIEAVSIASLAIRDKDINVIVIISNAFFAYASGLLGAAIVARSRAS